MLSFRGRASLARHSRHSVVTRSVTPWVQGLRSQLKLSVGPAYRVGEQRGKCKLDVRFEDGCRKTAVLPIPWLPAQAQLIQRAVEAIAGQVAMGLPLADAVATYAGATPAAPSAAAAPIQAQLMDAWEAFGHYKVQQTGQIKPTTWAEEYHYTAKRLEQVADAVNAVKLLTRAGEAWKPGQRRRQITLQHIAAMLRWACSEQRLPVEQWQPPADISRFVGTRVETTTERTPLRDEQILALLEALPADAAGKRWLFAFQLMAAYGLRPVELSYLRISATGELWCDYRKRSGGGTTQPRQLRALHPEWEQEWQLRERIAAGDALPPDGGGYGNAARRYLDRQSVWCPMKAAGCTSYSFRHGYALRAHQAFGLSVRVAAKLMGHSVETHVRHYGSWADADTIDAAIAQGMKFRQLITTSP